MYDFDGIFNDYRDFYVYIIKPVFLEGNSAPVVIKEVPEDEIIYIEPNSPAEIYFEV